MAFAFPILLALLSYSLQSEAEYLKIKTLLSQFPMSWGLFSMLLPFLYHSIFGIRHMLMDLGLGESLSEARMSAKLCLVLFIIATIFLGAWLC